MQKLIVISLILLSSIASVALHAQSAVFVYKNPNKAEGEYMCVRGMPNLRDAEFLTKQKLEELVNDDQKIIKYASTDSKGHGMVIRGIVVVGQGGKMPVFGAALGCKSFKEAESKALQNLKEFNPEWKSGEYVVVYKFKDN